MTTITPIDQPARWLVDADETLNGQTAVGEQTGVQNGLPVVYGEGEQGFLDAVAGAPAFAPPALPQRGTWLEAGDIYTSGADLLMVRQSHYRTEHDPATVPALFMVHRPNGDAVLAWVGGERVSVSTRRTFGGNTYRCIQAHVTQADWTPPAVPALWALVAAEPPPGDAQWATGVAYSINQRAVYNGTTYRCIQAHTSQAGWTPPAVPALWARV